ncbi:MAG: 3-deoxy-7-phosphoheptulonate synthase [Oscillospiraceae bacterium]|nr:3-deoxy-7-phosphoheptulonate synthase [Oscillospiraceae bacterium]
MIVVLKENPNPAQLDSLVSWLEEKQIAVNKSVGTSHTILGLVGDTAAIDGDLIASLEIVESVKRVQEPYKHSNKKFHPEPTVITVRGCQIGGDALTLIAGPCSVESEDQIVSIAKQVKAAGATMLLGGAFQPRTSPYAFQGLGADGIAYLKTAREETGLPIVSEITDADQLSALQDIDIIQVGSRNMQNFSLLKELGRQEKPILLKRGASATYEEWLMSAEYIMNGGNPNVILCESGIRTFEPYTRQMLDIGAVNILRHLTHLPILVDPSRACSKAWMVPKIAPAAVAAGADGLMIEVHNDPKNAICDGKQSITPEIFHSLAHSLHDLHAFLQKGETL